MAVPQGIKAPFELSSTRGSPVVAQNVALLESSMRMILKTVPGERPYRPGFGSWLNIMVFANMSEGVAFQAVAEAKRALTTWEPRIRIQDILFELQEPSTIALTVVWRPNGAASTFRTTIEFRT
jgi:Bacteriophage baseplate protein W